ncbi:hypothetical protein PS874_04508 [Pseudomonas fluorescens]|nr:hypothetical protein PS874_04508 [Pseudomonas fluorescens]
MGAARMNYRLSVPAVISMLLLGFGASDSYAATIYKCTELWYPQAKVGQRIFELQPERTADCQKVKKDLKSRQFGEVDGMGYFITRSEETSYDCPRVASGVGFPNFRCLIPKVLQRDVLHETRKYYLLTGHGADLRPLGDSGYATDGRTVFLFTRAIDGADPATFQLFDTKDGDGSPEWAQDSNHIYYEENSIPDMTPGELTFAGPFVVNGKKVFQFDSIDGVKLRQDVRPSLKLLAAGSTYYGSLVSDGQRIYLNGKSLDGLHAADFQMLTPACPVPGHPELQCLPSIPVTGSTPRFHLARVGNDVLHFLSHDKVVRIVDVPDFSFFQPVASDRVLGISEQRLFFINNYTYSPEGVSFRGQIRGPIAGALIDDAGFVTPFPWAEMPLCYDRWELPQWPESVEFADLGRLRRLADTDLPKGFTVGLENARYRYLFTSRDKRSPHDTIIDLRNGHGVRMDCK